MWRFTCSACEATSKPATTALPSDGRLSPQSMRMAVVLPAPLAPRNPNISPRLTLKDIWSVATKLPKRFVRFSAIITFSSVIFLMFSLMP